MNLPRYDDWLDNHGNPGIQSEAETDFETGFGGQDITYEREICPLSERFPKHLPGILEGCTCDEANNIE